jgi:hypothetical protein
MIAYVVADGQFHVDLLRILIPADLLQDVWFVPARGTRP